MYTEWGLAGLLAISFLAATILPFSSEAVFVFFLSTGFSPIACFMVALIGNSLGGSTNILLGRWGRNAWHWERLWAKERIERYGAWLAWLSWVPFIGDPLLIALGYYRTPWIPTIIYMVMGKAIRYGVIWYVYTLT